MEEIRKIVDAYYENCTPDFQKKVQAVFNEMKTDRNGKIDRKEYENYVGKPIWPPFRDLDRNYDGLLDFKDIIVFFYMKYVRDISHCNNCAENLISMYFTCVECLEKSNNSSTAYNATYDLCINCYSRKNFNHGEHKNFLDNRALVKYLREDLRSRSTRKDAANMASSSASRGNQIVPAAQVSGRAIVPPPQVPSRAIVPPPRVPSRAIVPPPQVSSRAIVPPPQVSSRAIVPPPQVSSRAIVPAPQRTSSTRQGSKDVADKASRNASKENEIVLVPAVESSSRMEIVPYRSQEGPSNVGLKLFAQALGIVANVTTIAALIAAGSCTIM